MDRQRQTDKQIDRQADGIVRVEHMLVTRLSSCPQGAFLLQARGVTERKFVKKIISLVVTQGKAPLAVLLLVESTQSRGWWCQWRS